MAAKKRIDGFRRRILSSAGYLLFAGVFLGIVYNGDTFCGGRHHHIESILVFSMLAALWDAVSGLVASAVDPFVGLPRRPAGRVAWESVFTCMFVAALGFLPVPVWIYRGFGHFRFEGTWLDFGCLFAEGYSYGYLMLVGPFLTAASGVREGCLRWNRIDATLASS